MGPSPQGAHSLVFTTQWKKSSGQGQGQLTQIQGSVEPPMGRGL